MNISDIDTFLKERTTIHDRCVAEIDIPAIRHNIDAFREHVAAKSGKPMLIFASVKANAYGHGIVHTARFIQDKVDYLGVACMEEAVKLRRNNVTAKILVLGACFKEDFKAAVKNDITLTVFDMERAAELDKQAAELDKKASIHIAVDTGMSRIGITPDAEGLETVKGIMELPNVEVTGIFMHFATADETDKSGAMTAYERFIAFKGMCTDSGISIPVWHCANTAAAIDDIGLNAEMDMARIGIGIYGLYPSDEVRKSEIELIPALSWYSYLSFIKDIKAGTSVSYGYKFTADRDMRIGTVNCGYADGYRRELSKRGAEVIVRGKRCRVLGTICMDQFMVDLSDVPDARIEDRVMLIGRAADSFEKHGYYIPHIELGPEDEEFDEDLFTRSRTIDEGYADRKARAAEMDKLCPPVTADELGRLCDTISYEIICGISARSKRVYIEDCGPLQRP